jgi:hypothetical protein
VSADPQEPEGLTDEARELPDKPVPPERVEAEAELPPAGPPWKKIALVVGGVVMIAAGASIVTLGATHKSAVLENAKAYVNGLVDGYSNGFVDGFGVGANTLFEGDQFD